MTDDLMANSTVIIKQKYSPPPLAMEETTPGIPLLQSFFDLPVVENTQREQMSEVYDWAKSMAETDDDMDILRILKDVRYRLGDSKLSTVHRYVKIRQLSKQYEIEAKAMEK